MNFSLNREQIEEMTDEANLQALQAALEAARCCEQGRGLPAAEVRALAERTTRATGELHEMLTAIRAERGGAMVSAEQRG